MSVHLLQRIETEYKFTCCVRVCTLSVYQQTFFHVNCSRHLNVYFFACIPFVLLVKHNETQMRRVCVCVPVRVLSLTRYYFCGFRYRPRTYCLADSDEESSSAGSSDEEDSSDLSNDPAGAEG